MTKDTKTALLDSAEDVVRRRGFDSFSFADLSNAVGIRKASVHHHFPTKAALSIALLVRYSEDLERRCAAIDRTHDTASARLVALIGLYRDALEDGEKLCLCVALITSRESLSETALERIVGFRTMMEAWITLNFARARKDRSIRDVAEPAQEARAMLATLEGAQLAARAATDPSLFDGALALLLSRCATDN